jgi:7-carboxy-7-deazaguanine synthase
MTVVEVVEACERLWKPNTSYASPHSRRPVVTLSGGNPALHPDLYGLINALHRQDFSVALETQGSTPNDAFRVLDYLVLSPKAPSSGMAERFNATSWQRVLLDGPVGGRVSVKLVVDPQYPGDVDWAFEFFDVWVPTGVPCYLQPVNRALAVPPNAEAPAVTDLSHVRAGALDAYVALVEQVLARRASHVRVLPQVHVAAWGNQGGV